jgi:hypothetical protein
VAGIMVSVQASAAGAAPAGARARDSARAVIAPRN